MAAVKEPLAVDPSTVVVRVLGPESSLVTPADLRRVFAGRSVSVTRRDRIARSTKAVALHGTRVVALAGYERASDELRVYELAIDPDVSCSVNDLLQRLVDAIELACLAGGCKRLVVLPSAIVAPGPLERLGYRRVVEGCAGGWLEKRFA